MFYLISINSVKDFISFARPKRDLRFGSRLLSDLSKVTAKTIVEENLIFHAILSGDSLDSFTRIQNF